MICRCDTCGGDYDSWETPSCPLCRRIAELKDKALSGQIEQVIERLRNSGGDAWDDADIDQELASLRGQPQGTEARVCDDITERQALGISKYGTTVEQNPLPLRQWLQHAYEEALDLAIYLKRSIEQLDRDKA
jgi:hypothetical protein